MKEHIINQNTLVCSCGNSYEKHLQLDLDMEKIVEKRLSGGFSIDEEFKEVDKYLNALQNN